MSDQLYGFERWEVYRVAYAALELVLEYRDKLRGLPGDIGPQLVSAAVSTVGNIAEAYGRVTRPDRNHKLTIARGEANEAGATIEIAKLFGVFSDEDYATLRSRYQSVTWMLTAMLRR